MNYENGDWKYENEAEIKTLTNVPNKNDEPKTSIGLVKTPIKDSTADKAKTETIVTPPTGSDRQTIIIYAVIGIVMLIITMAGITIIKKKVF